MSAHTTFTTGVLAMVAGFVLLAAALIAPLNRRPVAADTAQEFGRLFSASGAVFMAFALIQTI